MSEALSVRERVINRDRELAQFEEILSTSTHPCLVSVQERSGVGKSSLLELFEDATNEVGHPVVRSVMEGRNDLMWLAKQIGDGLAEGGALCDRYTQLDAARTTHAHADFGWAPAPSLAVTVANERSRLDHSPTTVSVNAPVAALPWDDGHERVAQQRCLEALLDDLRGHSRRSPVVLLLDQFDNANPLVTKWLKGALLNRVFAEADPFGCLVLVVASNDPVFPNLGNRLGERSGELLRRIRLSEWNEAEFLRWVGQFDLSAADRTFLHHHFRRGRPVKFLAHAVRLVQLYEDAAA